MKHASGTQCPLVGFSVAVLALAAAIVLVALPFLSQLALPSGPGPVMDPNFGIPALPLDSPYNSAATQAFTWIGALIVVGGVAWTLPEALRRKSPVLPVLALSGVGACIPEVFVDVLGAVWYPRSLESEAYTILGRQMPWMIILAWGSVATIYNHLFYRYFRRGVSDWKLLLLFLAAALSTFPLEEVLLHFGQYYYYGNQPLVLFAKYPFWWMFCNIGGLFLASALAYRLETQLKNWRSLAILLMTPMSVSGLYGFIAIPAWIAVNGNYSWLVTQAAGLLTILMGFVAVALVIQFIVRGGPVDAVDNSP